MIGTKLASIKKIWLVSTDPKYDEDGDPVDDPDELSYILNTPQKIVISVEQLEFGDAFPFLLSTEESGDDLTAILQKMLNRTILLKMGWHLGTEAEFRDSFKIELLPSSSPTLSEDEELWHEYYESKAEEQNI